MFFFTKLTYVLLPAYNIYSFNPTQVVTATAVDFGQRGSPWEFNLRDIFRWCDLLLGRQAPGPYAPSAYAHLIYVDRRRTPNDKCSMQQLYTDVCGHQPHEPQHDVTLSRKLVQVGRSVMERRGRGHSGPLLLHHSLGPMESLSTCVQMKWMSILVSSIVLLTHILRESLSFFVRVAFFC